MDETQKLEADFVVVGAGTAGCILASRLSEDPKTSVILTEAGPRDNNPLVHIPIGFSNLLYNPKLNWGFETTAQDYLESRRIDWPRGKLIGGSSSINGMIWVRGDEKDFDDWAVAAADARWSWQGCQKYFQLCEDAPENSDPRLGRGGMIPLSVTSANNIAVDAFLSAGQASGLPLQRSLGISDKAGVGYYLTTIREGRRISSAVAYLKKAEKRRNLRVLTSTSVSKIVLSDDRVATGVIGHKKGKRITINARRGVILSAGTVGSPQLLMLSGIGDGRDLKKHGIGVAIDSREVGANLQDHFGARVMSKIAPPVSINSDFRRPWRLAKYAAQYFLSRSGPLSIGGAYAGAFFSPTGKGRPTMQIHFLPLTMKGKGWNFHKFSGVTANVCQLRPKSRGKISLATPFHEDAPLIDPKYLSHEEDQAAIVDGVKFVRKMLRAPSFVEPMKSTEFWPGAEVESDSDILSYAKSVGNTVFHPVGTCRMGADSNAVVNSQGLLNGAQNLWVADASIMPNIPSGNTNAATAMIAEQISDIIKTGRHN